MIIFSCGFKVTFPLSERKPPLVTTKTPLSLYFLWGFGKGCVIEFSLAVVVFSLNCLLVRKALALSFFVRDDPLS